MQKSTLKQLQQAKLSQQQLQFVKLLQLSGTALQTQVEQELVDNPLLEREEEKEEAPETAAAEYALTPTTAFASPARQRKDEGLADWQMRRPAPISAQERLQKQASFLPLSSEEHKIAAYLMGSLDDDGYLRLSPAAAVEDLAVTAYLETSVAQVQRVLKQLQTLDPPGIFAHDLQECLLLQLERQPNVGEPAVQLALQVVKRCFSALGRRNYAAIAKQLALPNSEALKPALACISQLDPRPGRQYTDNAPVPLLYPDFVVTRRNGPLEIYLQRENRPHLRIKREYRDLLATTQQPKAASAQVQVAADFVRKKLTQAHWFLLAVQQRQQTLQRTMEAIVAFQQPFFETGDTEKLRPLTLKQVAERIDRDISTISRSVRDKAVQTDFGSYPLKFFFAEGLATAEGEVVSNTAIKEALTQLVEKEDKTQPYTDDQLVIALRQQGYSVARRTVAKYRKQLKLPVAHLRREV